jgi:two-component SAPR family response regulator/heme exporter protein D
MFISNLISPRSLKSQTLILFLILFFFPGIPVSGQQYGLRFSGAEVPQHKRTSLDLNPEGFFSFRNEFSLAFDLSFPPNLHRYYGYILRIIDNEDTNIDLVFNFRGYALTGLTVIYKNEQTNIFLKTNLTELFDDWKTITLSHDFEKNQLTLSLADTSIVAKDIVLNPKVKILFGGNDYKYFKTTDVPPMIIKDIRLSDGNKLLHHWPLNESTGNSEADVVRKRNAIIENPTWVRRLFQNWDNILNGTLEGQVAVTFNEKEEKILFAGQNAMTIYSPAVKRSENIKYNNKPHGIIQGRQAYFDTIHNKLVLFNIWNTTFSSFDFNTFKWDSIYTGPRNPTLYWHFNKHYLEKDNSLLIFGGYGQYEFRNLVHKLSLSTHEYDTLPTSGDTFHPRYLAALGAKNDTMYFLGGRGSVSGRQIESPRNFYDLTAFSLKDNKFHKHYDYTPPVDDAVFANSLVIDKTNDSFYALTFTNYEYYSNLQLVRGSFKEPRFELLGDKIPFKFEDIFSFSDLYYCKSINKLVAVTLFYDKDAERTDFSVFTISFPPETFTEYSAKGQYAFWSNWFVVLLVIMGVVLLVILPIIYQKYYKKKVVRETQTGIENSKDENEEVTDSLETDIPITDAKVSEDITFKNTILFFGGFKIFNKDSDDITNKFSPLIKEIFLLVWLNSMNGGNGVSSEKMKELFWFHKDDKQATNNRSVNIAKLKSLLEELDSCTLSRETGYWKIEFDEEVVYNDYWVCLKSADNKKVLQKIDIVKLINVVNKGSFLEDLSYEWLDAFKADISNVVIDTLVGFGLSFDIKKHPCFILNLANTIFKFDIVNEEAMILKCKALIEEGKHSMAKKCYTEFQKNYKALYDTDFEESYSDIIK